jgi:hypothetical protein
MFICYLLFPLILLLWLFLGLRAMTLEPRALVSARDHGESRAIAITGSAFGSIGLLFSMGTLIIPESKTFSLVR